MINNLNKKHLLQALDKINSFSSLGFYFNQNKKRKGVEVKDLTTIKDISINLTGETKFSDLIRKVNNLQNLDFNKEITDVKNKSLFTSSNISLLDKESFFKEVSTRLNSLNLYTYLNSLSKFNSKIAKGQYLLYSFNKVNNNLILFKKAINIINLSFSSMGCLISNPHISVVYNPIQLDGQGCEEGKPKNKKIIIQLFYFVRFRKNLNNLIKYKLLKTQNINRRYCYLPAILNKNIYQRYPDKFNLLSDYLTNLLGCEIELDLIRLNKPYYNSNILVQYLALQSYKNRFVRLVSRLFRKMNVYYNKKQNLNNLRELKTINLLNNKISNIDSFPSFVSGLHIRMAGRTFKQKIIPRITEKQIQKGILSNEKVKLIEKSRFTGKTKRGSYSFTVTLGHIL